MRRIKSYLQLLRTNQWIKNSLLFSAIFFNSRLFDPVLFRLSFFGFLVFCGLSSASYIFNDIIDMPEDQKHPLKKKRPLAAGEIQRWPAILLMLILAVVSLAGALWLDRGLFLMSLMFIVLHLFYTLSFKKWALLDVFSIALSFIIRVLGSEILTGYHLSAWLFLTIFFAALFVASAKRHAELVKQGTTSRPALEQYEERLLNFYVATFATSAIISYTLFAFLQPTLRYESGLAQLLISMQLPKMVERKWMLLTTPLMVFGIARYGHLVYVGKKGERPERLITTDLPLVGAIGIWAVIVFILLYL